MKKIRHILITTFSCGLTLSILIGQPSETFAQIRGENSREFFEEGNQEMQQEMQTLEEEQPTQTLENREEKLEQELQINKKAPNVPEESPAPPESLDPNVPESSDSEVEIKF